MKRKTWQPFLNFLKEHLLSFALFCGVFFILLFGLDNAQTESQQESLRIVEESITRTIVSCYAIEGMYPANLAYLQENYGLAVDESRYFVDYQIFASNIMPTVTVIEVIS